jgi:hypothetical protein
MGCFKAIEAVCNALAAYYNYKTENLPSREERVQLECESIEDEIHELEGRGGDADVDRARVLRVRLRRRQGVLADISNADAAAGGGDGGADGGRNLPGAG